MLLSSNADSTVHRGNSAPADPAHGARADDEFLARSLTEPARAVLVSLEPVLSKSKPDLGSNGDICKRRKLVLCILPTSLVQDLLRGDPLPGAFEHRGERMLLCLQQLIRRMEELSQEP